MVMNTKEKGLLNFVIFRDAGEKHFTAVCLDFDIVEQGEDPTLLKASIEEAAQLHLETVIENDLSDELLNRSAPQKYWKKLYDGMVAYEELLKQKEAHSGKVEAAPEIKAVWNKDSRELCPA